MFSRIPVRPASVLAVLLVVGGCTSGSDDANVTAASNAPAPSTTSGAATSTTPVPDTGATAGRGDGFGPPPVAPTGDLPPSTVEDLDAFYSSLQEGVDVAALERLGESGDVRLAWVLSDVLRFFQSGATAETAAGAFARLTGVDAAPDGVVPGETWRTATDHLLAWDLPAPPGYTDLKRRMFTLVDPSWEPFFADDGSLVDWRLVSWGGVLADTREEGDALPCARGCIPALDDPATTDAQGGGWYPDEDLVFGVTVAGEARAYPKHIMEVHEMVNDTLGGRRLGIPYCTLCGSAQAYVTDGLPTGIDTPLLRTSGLLSRSNKVMFDLNTFSVFDTFTGVALSGPLREAGVRLPQVTVVTSTWGEWKAVHPETTIVAEDGGIGRSYPKDPLRGRDDDGPIFPIGDVDPRLPVQAQVMGVIAPDGTPVAFPVDQARAALDAGEEVELAGIRLRRDASGVRPELAEGGEVSGHQAFWFAWSQFHPGTLLWSPLG